MVTKEQFIAYVEVQESGATNMFDINTVCAMAIEPLTREDCLDIMKNYRTYYKQWMGEEQ